MLTPNYASRFLFGRIPPRKSQIHNELAVSIIILDDAANHKQCEMKKQPAQNRHWIFDRTSWSQIQMQGKLSSRSNSIWSINKSNRIVQELQPSGHLNLMIRHPAEYQWARSMLGQLDQSTEQTICNIHTNIITRQTNPLCTEAFNENSNSKKPRNYVARATINLTSSYFD